MASQFITVQQAVNLFDNDTDAKPLVDLAQSQRDLRFIRDGINYHIALDGEHKGEDVFVRIESERDQKLLEIAIEDAIKRVDPSFDRRGLQTKDQIAVGSDDARLTDEELAKIANGKK